MLKKEELIKRLHDSPLFKLAMARAENDEQRDQVRKMTEAFLLKFGAGLQQAHEQIQNDPEFGRKLRKALIERGRVVTSEPKVSGSKD